MTFALQSCSCHSWMFRLLIGVTYSARTTEIKPKQNGNKKVFHFSRCTFEIKQSNKNAKTAVKRFYFGFLSILFKLCGHYFRNRDC